MGKIIIVILYACVISCFMFGCSPDKKPDAPALPSTISGKVFFAEYDGRYTKLVIDPDGFLEAKKFLVYIGLLNVKKGDSVTIGFISGSRPVITIFGLKYRDESGSVYGYAEWDQITSVSKTEKPLPEKP